MSLVLSVSALIEPKLLDMLADIGRRMQQRPESRREETEGRSSI